MNNMVEINTICRFRLKESVMCGVKHTHRANSRGIKGYQYRNDIELCCNCGHDKWKIIGMGNWNDRYHIQCAKCFREKVVWQLGEVL